MVMTAVNSQWLSAAIGGDIGPTGAAPAMNGTYTYKITNMRGYPVSNNAPGGAAVYFLNLETGNWIWEPVQIGGDIVQATWAPVGGGAVSWQVRGIWGQAVPQPPGGIVTLVNNNNVNQWQTAQYVAGSVAAAVSATGGQNMLVIYQSNTGTGMVTFYIYFRMVNAVTSLSVAVITQNDAYVAATYWVTGWAQGATNGTILDGVSLTGGNSWTCVPVTVHMVSGAAYISVNANSANNISFYAYATFAPTG
jgi:hypothetical protein